jgi:predicted nuclease with RNAse H fold
MSWAGVDVGGRRKGFHAALVDGHRLRALARAADPASAVAMLRAWGPRLVAVDSPRSPAPDGLLSRPEEVALVRARVCGLRYTPDRRALTANARYYEWVEHGLELYEGFEQAGLEAIECFPTASWTRWSGARGSERRSRWSRRALAQLTLEGVPDRLSQDDRDAIAAAVTARLHEEGRTEAYGEIVVPL